MTDIPRPMSVMRNDPTVSALIYEVAALASGHIDDEIAPALDAIGVVYGCEKDATRAQQQAAATLAMERMQSIQRIIDEMEDVRDTTMKGIAAMAETRIAPHRQRLAMFREWVLMLSELIEWGKVKSHDTPFGTFGTRKSGATYALKDRAALATWAAKTQSEHSTVTLTLSLADARQRFTETEIAEKGELDVQWKELKADLESADTLVVLPDGVEAVPERRTPYVKTQ